jgi:stage IV sporulation protein B
LNKLRPLLGLILASFILAISFSPQAISVLSLPDYQRMVVGESSHIVIDLPSQLASKLDMKVTGLSTSVFASPQDPPVSIIKNDAGYEIVAIKPGKVDVKLNLWGYIPLKSMAIESVPNRRVVVGGHSIGVMLQSRGIMVVGFAPVIDNWGEKRYPARDSGVEIGDLIFRVDGRSVNSENDLAMIIDEHKDREIVLEIKRKGQTISLPVQAVYCGETGRYRIGLFVRDGVVGVGTLTFWEPQSKVFAALGHIIIDGDTKQGIDVLKGQVVSASIQSVKPGRPGKPGEKIGIFNSNGPIKGSITKNTYYGIFGQTEGDVRGPFNSHTIEVGYAHQVKEGQAEMYTVVNGDTIEAFSIEIEKVYPERENGKGMIIRVTDPRLLTLTGGIIQGMSGSPIVQNSRLVGAITHVFLNDPQRGYGVFMDNMLAELPGGNMNFKTSTNY